MWRMELGVGVEFKVKKVKRCQGLLKRSKHTHIYHGSVFEI